MAFLAFLAAYLGFAADGWTAAPDGCVTAGDCYCESATVTSEPVLARQPSNTWSNLAAVVAGLGLLFVADRERGRRAANPMREGGAYAIAYGALVLFLGPGSMAFHGSLTRVGGWLDTLSMITFISFLLAYDLARVARTDHRPALVMVAFATWSAGLALLTWFADGTGVGVFAVLVAAAVVLEVAIAWKRLGGVLRRPVPWLIAAIGLFVVALVIWALSRSGGQLCTPTSLLQGHAIWHVLAMAVVPWLLFGYVRSEIRLPPSAEATSLAAGAKA
jgi:hypothetical protein